MRDIDGKVMRGVYLQYGPHTFYTSVFYLFQSGEFFIRVTTQMNIVIYIYSKYTKLSYTYSASDEKQSLQLAGIKISAKIKL